MPRPGATGTPDTQMVITVPAAGSQILRTSHIQENRKTGELNNRSPAVCPSEGKCCLIVIALGIRHVGGKGMTPSRTLCLKR